MQEGWSEQRVRNEGRSQGGSGEVGKTNRHLSVKKKLQPSILSVLNYFFHFGYIFQIGQKERSTNLALFLNVLKIEPHAISTNYFLHVLQQSFSVMLKKE